MQQSPRYLTNLMDKEPSKESTVIADLPDIDILCLQEVWERFLVEIHQVFFVSFYNSLTLPCSFRQCG